MAALAARARALPVTLMLADPDAFRRLLRTKLARRVLAHAGPARGLAAGKWRCSTASGDE